LELIEACACFEKKEWDDTTASDEGTMMHNVLETGDRRLLETPEQEMQINKCILIQEKLEKKIGEGFTVYKERRLEVVDPETGVLITRGTADLTLVSKCETKAILLDWKMGILPISKADVNLQLQAYTAGLFQGLPKLKQVTGVLVAPRQDFYSESEYYVCDVLVIIDRIKQTILKREAPFKLPTCDETACTLCKLTDQCPALSGTAITAFKGLGVLPLPSEFQTGRLATPLDRAKAQVLAKILEKWAVDIRKYNTISVIEHGEEVPPGFAVRKRAGGYGIDNTLLSELVGYLTDKYKLDPSDPGFMQCFSLSATKLGTYLSDKTNIDKKDILLMLSDDLPEIVQERAPVVYLQKKSKKITDEQILLGEIPE
jgi:hypothetical protein